HCYFSTIQPRPRKPTSTTLPSSTSTGTVRTSAAIFCKRARACESASTSYSTKSRRPNSSHSRISSVYGQRAAPNSSSFDTTEHLQHFAYHVINGSLHLLDTGNVIRVDDNREISDASPQNLTTIVAKQRNREQIVFARFFKGHNDIARAAAGGDANSHVFRAQLCDQLTKKNHLCADIVGNGCDVGGLHRQRNRRDSLVVFRRHHAINRPVVRVGGRTSIAEDDEFASAGKPFINRMRRAADLLGLFRRYLFAKARVIADFDLDGGSYLRGQIFCLLFLLAEERIEKFRSPHIMPQFTMLEVDVNGLPQRVIEDLNQLLVHESIICWRLQRKRGLRARQRKGHGTALLGDGQCCRNPSITLRRAEAHHHVIWVNDGFQPRAEQQREVQCRQSSLAYNYRMHKLHRDVLCIRSIRSTAKRQQTSATKKAL